MSINTDQIKYHQQLAAKSRGFSLLEVMIALLVLSIGMLGIAGLQAAAIRHNEDANVRTQATLIINDAINRMQTRSATMTPVQRMALIAQYQGTAPAGTCNPALSDIANDIACLSREIDDLFPGATLTFTDNANRTFTINLRWFNRDLARDVNTDWNIRL